MIFTDKTTAWFEDFTESYKENGTLPSLLMQKKEHSYRVTEICAELILHMEWDEPEDTALAHTIGLLHDIGRFAQYKEFGTFNDGQSVDHGDLSAQILEESFDWSEISEKSKRVILAAIRFHNKIELPADLSLYQYKWAALIRDADKVDIFRSIQKRIENGTIYDMLPRHKLASGLSPALAEEVARTGKGSYANAKSLEDYRLIQLTWTNDLNYPYALQILKEEGLFNRIRDDLKNQGIDNLLDAYMQKIAAI